MDTVRNPDLSESLPVIVEHLSANQVTGSDRIATAIGSSNRSQPIAEEPFTSAPMGTETAAFENHVDGSQHINRQVVQIVSINMPTTPIGNTSKESKRFFLNDGKTIPGADFAGYFAGCNTHRMQLDQITIHSMPLQEGSLLEEAIYQDHLPQHPKYKTLIDIRCNCMPLHTGSLLEEAICQDYLPKRPNYNTLIDKRCNSFKTRSWKLERQISALPDYADGEIEIQEALPADQHFDAFEGPELEILRHSEEVTLADDKSWPFVMRFPISSFSICLGISTQAVLWKLLATAASTKFLNISLKVNLVLWCISLALVALVSSIYLLKVILYFEVVRNEYYHPIRVNFFFAPWIALQLLGIGIPPSHAKVLHPALWYILMTPILCLELKIYGQWMMGGERRLSKVANPTSHVAIVGNFVGAFLGARMGLTEGPLFFFAVGLAHYIVLFVTLYQRLPTNETLPKELHPVFFLFIAVPSIGARAWAQIQGSFDYGSRIGFFIALFLYFSLVTRVNFFRGYKFSLVWWAYTVPMTSAAIAGTGYSEEVTNVVTRFLAVILSGTSSLTVIALVVKTAVHAFVFRDLFPNDIAALHK